MNIAIVDDMQKDREDLVRSLREYAAVNRLDLEISCCSGAEELLSNYTPLKYTIIFLDIYMGGMSGIEAAEQIRRWDDDVLLVFLTSSEDHRAEAFTHFASAYIIKPADKKTVYRTMDHLLHQRTEQEDTCFFFTSSRKTISISFKKIISLRTDKNYIVINDTNGEEYRTRMLFADAENIVLQDKRFVTINRGVIINLDHVMQITDDSCYLRKNITYPINRKKSKSIQQIWHNYNFEKLRREKLIMNQEV